MIPPSEEKALELNLDDRNRSQIVEDPERERAEGADGVAYYKRRQAGVWACLAALTTISAVAVV